MCRNVELSWLFNNKFRSTRNTKVKRMGITESLRRIWQFSSNKTNSSESFSRQPIQLIAKLNLLMGPIIFTKDSFCVFIVLGMFNFALCITLIERSWNICWVSVQLLEIDKKI